MNWKVVDGQPPFSALATIQINEGQPSAISGIFSISKMENIPGFLEGMSQEYLPMRQYSGVLFQEDQFFDTKEFQPGKILFMDPSEKAYVDRQIAFEMAVAFGEGALERARMLVEENKLDGEWVESMESAIETLRTKVEQEKTTSEA